MVLWCFQSLDSSKSVIKNEIRMNEKKFRSLFGKKTLISPIVESEIIGELIR